ncbi:MAG TPA: response regulator transcription factor [Dehalococcoidia bacterium]|nr:response regulator transcription factor [Dehalococcoidia bacterium]
MKVLFASGDTALRGIAGYGLEWLGHEVQTAADGVDALMLWLNGRHDVALLDGDLPTLSGFDVCRLIRLSSAIPVVLFLRPLDEQELIRGYESGADDCIIKPFGIRQLQLRIEALLRRSVQSPSTPRRHDSVQVIFGDLVLDRPRMSVQKNHQPLTLTRTEFRILEYLMERAETIAPADELARYALADSSASERRSLKVHISRLRHKLSVVGGTLIEIRSFPRYGYGLMNRQVIRPAEQRDVEMHRSPEIDRKSMAGLDGAVVVDLQPLGRAKP